jgi:hypothetical protein
MIDLRISGALAEFYSRAWYTPALASYLQRVALNLEVVIAHAGACAVVPVVDRGNGRFDFGQPDVDPLAFVCECLGEDGETPVDIIAWPTDAPARVMSMLGRAGMVGLWAAHNPATYYLNKPLLLYRTPLNWLKAGCRGAAIADRRIASRQFLELPGAIAGEDHEHGRELLAIAEMVVDRTRILAPSRHEVTR